MLYATQLSTEYFDYRLVTLVGVIGICAGLAALTLVGWWTALRRRSNWLWILAVASCAGVATFAAAYAIDALLSQLHLGAGEPLIDDVLIGLLGANFVALMTSIHSRWLSRKARELEVSERRYRLLFDGSMTAVYRSTLDGRVLDCNPAYCELFGYASREEVLAGNAADRYATAGERSEFLARLQRDQRITNLDICLRRKDGSPVWVLMNAALLENERGLEPVIDGALIDITERKRAEKDMRRMATIVQSSDDAIISVSPEGIVESWNTGAEKMYGYVAAEALGKLIDFLIPPDGAEELRAMTEQVNQGREVRQIETVCVHKDGHRIAISLTVSPIRDAQGIVVGSCGIAREITDLKKAEKSLKESEGRYLSLLNSTAEAIYGLDLQGTCTFCNPACVRMLGYRDAGDLIGRNMHALMHHTRADGAPYQEQECEIYLALREGAAKHVSDEVLWRADGGCFPAEYWSYPMYKAGEIVGAVVTFLDISERKRAEEALRASEEKYRKLFENATYGIFLANVDGTLLNVNPAMVTLLGYSSKAELLTRNLNRDIYENFAERKSILECYQSSGRADGVEANWKRKDGKLINVRMSGGAAREPDGSLGHIEVIVEDITDRRTLEEQFRQAQKMEAVGRLAGGVAHDFNNLLMIINTYSQMLGEQLTADAKMHRMADQVLSAGRKAASLTQQLLTFSRRQVLLPSVLDLNSVLADLGRMLPRLIGEDIDLQMVPGEKLGRVKADASQIQQVILNLTVNSRDALPNGGRIAIETMNVVVDQAGAQAHGDAPPGRYVMLSVSDNGTGMDVATQARIFEPFFTTKDVDKGTGLGLSIVFGIVKQSGGYISVNSQLWQGTTFKILLPRADAALPPKEATPAPIRGGTETILLVEDAEGVRMAVCDFLEGIGYKVINAANPAEALGLLAQPAGPVHLLLTDVIMPGLSGRELARQVKAEHPGMQVLFMSGYTDRGSPENESVDFNSNFLQKPFGLDQLARKLREVLERTN